MKAQFHILYPDATEPVSTKVDTNMTGFDFWLQSMIGHPGIHDDVIFFLTIQTTDIFELERALW